MKNFTDGVNQWAIDINVGSIKRVLAETKINLSLPHDEDNEGRNLADRLIRDTILQVDVIYALLKPQIDKLSLSMDQFFDLFKPDVMRLAEEALLEEWKGFFRNLGRTAQADAIDQAQKLVRATQEEAVKQLARLGERQINVAMRAMEYQVDKAMKDADDAMSSLSSESATSSPDALESAMSIGSPGEN